MLSNSSGVAVFFANACLNNKSASSFSWLFTRKSINARSGFLDVSSGTKESAGWAVNLEPVKPHNKIKKRKNLLMIMLLQSVLLHRINDFVHSVKLYWFQINQGKLRAAR